MFSKKITPLVFCLSLMAVLAGCEDPSTADKVADAQLCMDNATDATSANACVAKIADITTPEAYTLRCAAGFIGAGLTSPTNLSNALNAIKDNGSTASMLAYLDFGDTTTAATVFSNCQASNDQGLMLIAAMAKTATAVASYIPNGSTVDVTAVTNAINTLLTDLSGSGATQAAAQAQVDAIGSTIQAVYSVTCGTSNANTSICNSINDGAASLNVDISTATAQDIGNALLEYWKSGQH